MVAAPAKRYGGVVRCFATQIPPSCFSFSFSSSSEIEIQPSLWAFLRESAGVGASTVRLQWGIRLLVSDVYSRRSRR